MKLKVKRSIIIQKPASEIFNVISDLNNWNIWSPWIHVEPTSKTIVTGTPKTVGQFQTWEGEVVGSGKMRFTEINEPTQLKINLEFYKPWKSISETFFTLEKINNNETKVTWEMCSILPFFMIFFTKFMCAYMENDFYRGLSMLKELLETGTVKSKSIFSGEKNFEGFKAIGKITKCKTTEIPISCPRDFENLNKLLETKQIPNPISAINIYNKFDLMNGNCEYISALTYSLSEKISPPCGYEVFEFAEHKGLLIEHYGPYRHLSNAWSMAIGYLKAKKKKENKKIPMYEIYKTMPELDSSGVCINEEKIYTQIVLAIKR